MPGMAHFLKKTTLQVCCNLRQTVVLQTVRNFYNYLQCNLALGQLVWTKVGLKVQKLASIETKSFANIFTNQSVVVILRVLRRTNEEWEQVEQNWKSFEQLDFYFWH